MKLVIVRMHFICPIWHTIPNFFNFVIITFKIDKLFKCWSSKLRLERLYSQINVHKIYFISNFTVFSIDVCWNAQTTAFVSYRYSKQVWEKSIMRRFQPLRFGFFFKYFLSFFSNKILHRNLNKWSSINDVTRFSLICDTPPFPLPQSVMHPFTPTSLVTCHTILLKHILVDQKQSSKF